LTILEIQASDGYLNPESYLPALEACRKTGDTLTLRLPSGELRVRGDRLPERFVALSNNDSGMKRVAFPLRGLEKVSVEGHDTQLIFEGSVLPFDVEACDGVNLRGFSIDWARPFHFEGRVVSTDAARGTFDLEPSSECLWEIRGGSLWWCERPWAAGSSVVWYRNFGKLLGDARWECTLGWHIWMDPAERAVARDSRLCLFNAYDPNSDRYYRAERIDATRIRIHDAGLERLPEVGWVFVDKGAANNRRFPAIHLKYAKDVVLEDLTIHHADGMGVIAEFCENLRLSRLQVLPSGERAISTTADATHFVYCRGQILLESCRFECMPDDGINVHGNYFAVVGLSPDGRSWASPRHPQHEHVDFAQVGDRLARVDPENFNTLSEHQVRSVERRNGVAILLDCVPALPPESVGQVLENLSWQADLVMRDCVVRGNRARAVLFSTRAKGRIEASRFEDQSMSAILLEMEADYWHETGPTGSLEIVGNTIIGPAREFTEQPAILITPRLGTAGAEPLHGCIRIKDNHIVVDHGRVLWAGSVSELVFQGNTVSARGGEAIQPLEINHCGTVKSDIACKCIDTLGKVS